MKIANGNAIFLDTSIMIARFVHGPDTKRRIQARLKDYTLTVTSLVVRQEFRRRLLKEAYYLLKLFSRFETYANVQRHLHDVLPSQQARKRNICTDMLMTIFEGRSQKELTDRAILYLKSMLKGGLDDFDDLVDHVIRKSGCACGAQEVRKLKDGDYSLGVDVCTKVADACKVDVLVDQKSSDVVHVSRHLRSLSPGCCSDEIKAIVEFIGTQPSQPAKLKQTDPCTHVGDYLIALESAEIPTVYTMNGKESQHLCRPLNQTLIVRRPNPEHEDEVNASDAAEWTEY